MEASVNIHIAEHMRQLTVGMLQCCAPHKPEKEFSSMAEADTESIELSLDSQ